MEFLPVEQMTNFGGAPFLSIISPPQEQYRNPTLFSIYTNAKFQINPSTFDPEERSCFLFRPSPGIGIPVQSSEGQFRDEDHDETGEEDDEDSDHVDEGSLSRANLGFRMYQDIDRIYQDIKNRIYQKILSVNRTKKD